MGNRSERDMEEEYGRKTKGKIVKITIILICIIEKNTDAPVDL